MSAPRPYTVVAELSYRCPLKCVYCSNPVDFHTQLAELTTEQWCRTFTQAAELGVVQVHLSGGEPLVRNDVVALVRHARICDLYTNLITGGTLLDGHLLAELKAAGLEHVQLSIQDTDADTADRIAGMPSHAKKLDVAEAIRTAGFPLTLNVNLHRLNIARVPELIEQAVALGAQRLELANTQYYAWAFENRAALLPTRAQYEAAEQAARDARRRYQGKLEIAFVKIDYFEDRPKACSGGWARSYMCITPTGQVLPCHAAHAIASLRFESVKDKPLADIWYDSPGLNAYRGEEWMQEPCRSCEHRTKDFGGCRCQAFLLTGDAAATDPVCGLSPHHGTVLDATRGADTPASAPTSQTDGTLVYRDLRTSRRLASSARPAAPRHE